ncbi:MAG TPA: thiamine pyrophosphate-dependent enzyme [Devosiaceae bacterium]|jgi:acetolactate synthase-1/2/3 large subunit
MKVTGGEALAHQLVLEGVTDVFGIPGVQLDYAVNGLRQISDKVRFFVPRHEQTTAYMADGYARTTGKIGTCMVVPGPGLLNATAALSTAYACNSRVLCISGGIHSEGVGKNYGLLHEIKNQSEVMASVTKWNRAAKSAQEIPGLVREAIKQLNSGRPQPVGIEIPQNFLSTVDEFTLATPPDNEDGRIRPDAASIEKAAALLNQARFPVVYAGGGALAAHAGDALRAFAEKLKAPVVLSENGRGALSDRHPLALTTLGGRAVFPHADVVLVVGSRFADTTNGEPSWPTASARYIYINTDEHTWTGPRKAEVGIVADAALGLEALAEAIDRRKNAIEADLDRVRAWALAQSDALEPLTGYLRALRGALPDDGILINELTQVGYHARTNYPVYKPDTFITPGYQGTLGYGVPTAMGAAAGNPDKQVIGITGDGGFGWGMQELLTASKYQLNVAIVVFADGHFGNVKSMMTDKFGLSFGDVLQNPKFDKLAEAFDVAYARADDPAALERVLKGHANKGGPILVEAPVGKMPSPWGLMRLRAAGGKTPAPANPLGEPADR